MHIRNTLRIFFWLLWQDLRELRDNFWDNFINALIIPVVMSIIAGYILPHLGVPADYGSFTVVSTMVMMCYSSTAWRGAAHLVTDLEYAKSICYEFTLPLPSWLVCVKYACAYALKSIALNCLTIPIGKLFLWHSFDLHYMNVCKSILVYILINFFFGFFSLWTASIVKNSEDFGKFWLRYGSQIVFFSGFQFSWSVLYQALPFLAYLNFVNPFTYAFEGMRGAVLGSHTSLNYWLCVVMLIVSIFFFGLFSVRILKKRLDCI